MAIRSGQFLHDANGFVVDRIQTGGVSNLNIPEEKIYELGNYQTVATVRDIPDLSFDLESVDVSTEIEALLLGEDPTAVVAGDEFDFNLSKPIDIISPFKSAQGLYDVVRGIAVPYLNLESATYRFGTRQNATQSFTLRGDSVFYIPGSPYYEVFAGNGTATTFTFAHTAIAHDTNGDTIHALSVCVHKTDGTYKRLFYGEDYTDTTTGFTLTAGSLAPAGSEIHVVYGSATAATYNQTVHQDASVKPAAVRGKNIDVYVETAAGSDTLVRWGGVQSFEVSRRVNLENDEEFGNVHYVAQDYNTADVTGSIGLRPRDPADLFSKIHQVANVPSNEIVGTLTSATLQVELRISNPDTNALIKTLYIPDARFTVPGLQGRANQKLDTTFNFTSDGGQLLIYAGARP